jgi:hypothetical protein
MAVYERDTKTVTCMVCPPHSSRPASEIVKPLNSRPPETTEGPAPERNLEPGEVVTGTAGASATRGYERRKDKREKRIRDKHPHLGKLILALSDDPQSTRAWATGARGEEVLGQRLDKLSLRTSSVHVLHDRRILRTRANIDHIAVSAAGVFVIDAKKYSGRPSLRVAGGLFRPRVEKLMVGSRDRTGLVNGVSKQVDLVRAALQDAGFEAIPVHGVLCFVEADWPLIGGAFVIGGVQVSWPKKAVDKLLEPGPVDQETARDIHRTLATSFPPT